MQHTSGENMKGRKLEKDSTKTEKEKKGKRTPQNSPVISELALS